MNRIAQNKLYDRYVEEIRARRKYSNCYLGLKEIQEKIKAHTIVGYEEVDGLLLIENQTKMYVVYYMSENWEWISELEKIKKPELPLVISVVQRSSDGSNFEQEFNERGYTLYKKYGRLRADGTHIRIDDTIEADYCRLTDREQLRTMMDCTFDSKSDHIPEEDELDAFLTGNSIICVRENDLVKGFIIFEDKGKTSYIRMVCVSELCRGSGVGSKLMNMYFGIHEGYKSFTLWYDTNNIPAYALYHKWGYEKEDMYNLIFVI